MSVTCGRSVVFSQYSCFLHKLNWPQQHNWNIVESGVKYHNPNPNPTYLLYLYCQEVHHNYSHKQDQILYLAYYILTANGWSFPSFHSKFLKQWINKLFLHQTSRPQKLWYCVIFLSESNTVQVLLLFVCDLYCCWRSNY